MGLANSGLQKALEITSNQERPNVNACNNLDWLESEISMHMREYDMQGVYNKLVEFITAYNTHNKK